MKSTTLTCIFVMTLLAAWAVGLAAQNQQDQTKRQVRYAIKSLGTLGGDNSAAEGVNREGWVVGDSNLPGNQSEHAVLWRYAVLTDLGTLGGLNGYASSVNETGIVEGTAETPNSDPFNEDFCGFGTGLMCLGFVWREGRFTPLPTLGGNNGATVGFDSALNNLGQVVGLAETSTKDPSCIFPQMFDWEGVIWGPMVGEIQELPPLPGDTVSGAAAINDNGEVVGGSGPTCETPTTAASLHAVLWEQAKPVDLGSFGGQMNNLAWAINNHGQIVGFSDLTNDQTMHAFLWQKGVMTDLGTLPGDFSSAAYGINDKGQVIGQSCNRNGNCGSFLWQDGVMADLNRLIAPGSRLFLIQPFSINSEGEIVGQAFDQTTGEILPVVAIPCDEKHTNNEGCEDFVDGTNSPLSEGKNRPEVILPATLRDELRKRRIFSHF